MVNTVRGRATEARGRALQEHNTSYHSGLSLAWAAIFVVFGLFTVLCFAGR